METHHEITQQLEAWLDAVRRGDLDAVLACYAPDAVLLPTFSSAIRHHREEMRDYFAWFLSRRPQGTIVEQHPRRYDSVAINAGLCTFTVTDGQPDREIAVRFTFVYRRVADRWLIVEHHSSVLPTSP